MHTKFLSQIRHYPLQGAGFKAAGGCLTCWSRHYGTLCQNRPLFQLLCVRGCMCVWPIGPDIMVLCARTVHIFSYFVYVDACVCMNIREFIFSVVFCFIFLRLSQLSTSVMYKFWTITSCCVLMMTGETNIKNFHVIHTHVTGHILYLYEQLAHTLCASSGSLYAVQHQMRQFSLADSWYTSHNRSTSFENGAKWNHIVLGPLDLCCQRIIQAQVDLTRVRLAH